MDKTKSHQELDLRNILEQLLEIIKRQKEIYSIMESLITSYSSKSTGPKKGLGLTRKKSSYLAVDPRYYANKERDE